MAALLSALLELPKEDLANVQKWMTAGAASSMFRRIVLQGRMQVQQARPRPANVFLLHGVSGLLEVLPNIFRARLEIFQINLLLRRLSYFCHLISYTSFQFGQAGYYATDSATDEDGYGVSSGASSEVACPAGMISTSPEAIECEPCNPPSSSSRGSTICDECM